MVESGDAIEQLKNSVFSIVFQDGAAKMLSLPQLMAFVYNLIVLAHEWQQLEKMVAATKPNAPSTFKLSIQFSMQHIMTPETVKALFSKIQFSDTPSDT